MRLPALLVVALAAVTLGAAPAERDRDRADALVRDGAALGQRGEWEAAIARFREASALFPRALDHCNIGLAYVRWGKPAAGWLHLTRCEARATDTLPRWVAVLREEALTGLADGDYAPVEIVAEPRLAEVRIDAFPDEVLTTPVTVWLPFGEHAVTVTAPTFEPGEITVSVSGKAPLRRAITLTPTPAPTPDPPDDNATAPPVATDPPDDNATPVPSSTSGGGGPSTLRPPPTGPPAGWYVSGAGILVAGVGGVLYAVAAGTREDAAALPPGDAFVDKRAAFRRERDASYVLFAVGGAAIATGLVMLALPADDAPAVHVVPVSGGATLGVGGTF